MAGLVVQDQRNAAPGADREPHRGVEGWNPLSLLRKQNKHGSDQLSRRRSIAKINQLAAGWKKGLLQAQV